MMNETSHKGKVVVSVHGVVTSERGEGENEGTYYSDYVDFVDVEYDDGTDDRVDVNIWNAPYQGVTPAEVAAKLGVEEDVVHLDDDTLGAFERSHDGIA
jgi:hypothetical protein